MGLRIIILFVTACLLCDAASLKSQAYFNETADLPCQFVNSQNISMSELVIFWQDQEKLVLYDIYLGKKKTDKVALKYMGRTSFHQDNWTLQLHNIQIKDEGSYQCFIHHKGPRGLVPLHQMSSELLVLANFSEPEIVPISNITENSGINLTCSSRQGYPKPVKMSFRLITENSTIEFGSVMQISQDNLTELYNVSISLSVPFPDSARNVTIFCVLQTEPMEMQLLSLPFHIALKDPPSVPDQAYWIAAVVLCTLAFGFAVALCLKQCKRKKQQQLGVSYKETIKKETEERDETEESVRIHVPERKDEDGQCVVHSSKTPLDDRSATPL